MSSTAVIAPPATQPGYSSTVGVVAPPQYNTASNQPPSATVAAQPGGVQLQQQQHSSLLPAASSQPPISSVVVVSLAEAVRSGRTHFVMVRQVTLTIPATASAAKFDCCQVRFKHSTLGTLWTSRRPLPPATNFKFSQASEPLELGHAIGSFPLDATEQKVPVALFLRRAGGAVVMPDGSRTALPATAWQHEKQMERLLPDPTKGGAELVLPSTKKTYASDSVWQEQRFAFVVAGDFGVVPAVTVFASVQLEIVSALPRLPDMVLRCTITVRASDSNSAVDAQRKFDGSLQLGDPPEKPSTRLWPDYMLMDRQLVPVSFSAAMESPRCVGSLPVKVELTERAPSGGSAASSRTEFIGLELKPLLEWRAMEFDVYEGSELEKKVIVIKDLPIKRAGMPLMEAELSVMLMNKPVVAPAAAPIVAPPAASSVQILAVPVAPAPAAVAAAAAKAPVAGPAVNNTTTTTTPTNSRNVFPVSSSAAPAPANTNNTSTSPTAAAPPANATNTPTNSRNTAAAFPASNNSNTTNTITNSAFGAPASPTTSFANNTNSGTITNSAFGAPVAANNNNNSTTPTNSRNAASSPTVNNIGGGGGTTPRNSRGGNPAAPVSPSAASPSSMAASAIQPCASVYSDPKQSAANIFTGPANHIVVKRVVLSYPASSAIDLKHISCAQVRIKTGGMPAALWSCRRPIQDDIKLTRGSEETDLGACLGSIPFTDAEIKCPVSLFLRRAVVAGTKYPDGTPVLLQPYAWNHNKQIERILPVNKAELVVPARKKLPVPVAGIDLPPQVFTYIVDNQFGVQPSVTLTVTIHMATASAPWPIPDMVYGAVLVTGTSTPSWQAPAATATTTTATSLSSPPSSPLSNSLSLPANLVPSAGFSLSTATAPANANSSGSNNNSNNLKWSFSLLLMNSGLVNAANWPDGAGGRLDCNPGQVMLRFGAGEESPRVCAPTTVPLKSMFHLENHGGEETGVLELINALEWYGQQMDLTLEQQRKQTGTIVPAQQQNPFVAVFDLPLTKNLSKAPTTSAQCRLVLVDKSIYSSLVASSTTAAAASLAASPANSPQNISLNPRALLSPANGSSFAQSQSNGIYFAAGAAASSSSSPTTAYGGGGTSASGFRSPLRRSAPIRPEQQARINSVRSHLSPMQISSIIDAFDIFDKDSSGDLNFDELTVAVRTALRAPGAPPATYSHETVANIVRELIAACDTNFDGRVAILELRDAFAPQDDPAARAQRWEERRRAVAAVKADLMTDEMDKIMGNIALYDKNKDSVLDRAELEEAVRSVLGTNMSNPAKLTRLVDAIVAAADDNGDGKMSVAELRSAFSEPDPRLGTAAYQPQQQQPQQGEPLHIVMARKRYQKAQLIASVRQRLGEIEMKQIHNNFAYLDTENTGHLDRCAVEKAVRMVLASSRPRDDPKGVSQLVDDLITACDNNGDRYVSVAELQEAISFDVRLESEQRQKARAAAIAAVRKDLMDDEINAILINFGRFDVDKSGLLDRNELAAAVRSVLSASNVSDQKVNDIINRLIEAADEDHDGHISAKEIASAFAHDDRMQQVMAQVAEQYALQASNPNNNNNNHTSSSTTTTTTFNRGSSAASAPLNNNEKNRAASVSSSIANATLQEYINYSPTTSSSSAQLYANRGQTSSSLSPGRSPLARSASPRDARLVGTSALSLLSPAQNQQQFASQPAQVSITLLDQAAERADLAEARVAQLQQRLDQLEQQQSDVKRKDGQAVMRIYNAARNLAALVESGAASGLGEAMGILRKKLEDVQFDLSRLQRSTALPGVAQRHVQAIDGKVLRSLELLAHLKSNAPTGTGVGSDAVVLDGDQVRRALSDLRQALEQQ